MMEMINNVLNFPQIPDVANGHLQSEAPKEIAAAESASKSRDAGDQADLSQGKDSGPTPEYALRLTVDKDPHTGDWVYKAIDRYTGEIVRQLPRQEVLNLRNSASYKAGSVIKTDI